MRTITIVPYDPIWPSQFELLARPLRKALEGLYVEIHHVGSTAVEGLAAKPIIDIDIEIPDDANFDVVVRNLATLGYTHVGDQDVPGREVFKSDIPQPIAHHLYVCRSSSAELKRHLVLVDYLRTHRDARDAYAKVKREAAERYHHDIDGYLEHKGHFIQTIYKKCGLADERDML